MAETTPKKAQATLDSLRKVFTVPERDDSTLGRIEKEISRNLLGFLHENIVAGDLSPATLEKDFSDTLIPEDPVFVSEQADFLLNKVVAQSVHTSSPRFVGHMTSALPYFMLPLAKIMMGLNQNLVKIETSKAFTPLERQVVGMLHRLVYAQSEDFYRQLTQSREKSLGVFCSGGTIANITALWVARNRLLGPKGSFAGISKEGLFSALRYHGLEGLAVLVSKRGHYSLGKAVDLLGLGRNGLIPIKTTSQQKIDVASLRAEISRLKASKIGILAIIGVAGTTETGNVDPLDELANVSREVGCHFHVDAAWGGPTLFSSRYRHLLKGVDEADSVTIDAHKQLYVPMGAGIVLFKDETALGSIEHHAQYIIREGSRDLGKHTLEGSRPGMAMLVHSGLRILGQRGYEMLVDLGIGKAGQFAKMLSASEDFELLSEPELNLLTYRYRPLFLREILAGDDKDRISKINDILSELTASIQKEQRTAGKSFVSRTTFEVSRYGGQMLTVLRVVLANPLTTRQILGEILDEQRQYAADIMEREGFGKTLRDLVS